MDESNADSAGTAVGEALMNPSLAVGLETSLDHLARGASLAAIVVQVR